MNQTPSSACASLKGAGIILTAIVLFFFGNVCLYQGFYDGLTIIYLAPTNGPGFLLLFFRCPERLVGRKVRLASLGVLVLAFLSIIGTGIYADRYREPPSGWRQASNTPIE